MNTKKILSLVIVVIFLWMNSAYTLSIGSSCKLRIPLENSENEQREEEVLNHVLLRENDFITDVEYQSLKDAVDGASLEQGEIISCKDLSHYILFCPTDTEDGLPARWIYPSSLVNGGDIYIWASIRKEFKRPLILHEILEVTYSIERFGNVRPYFIPDSELEAESKKGHRLARQYDERYAKETLDKTTFKEYLDYRRKINIEINGENMEAYSEIEDVEQIQRLYKDI